MTKTIDAVFADGVFRPLQPVAGLGENALVRITLQSEHPGEHPFDGWVGTLPDEDAREMIQVIDAEFERVNPDEWK